MATQVWKYSLNHGETVVAMPKGAWVLTAQFQEVRMDGGQNDPRVSPGSVWAVVEPDAPTEDRTFHVLGTGYPMPEPPSDRALRWVGTYQIGAVVLHVFEEVIERDVPGWVEVGETPEA